jgi:CheY-like chemotaxis protein
MTTHMEESSQILRGLTVLLVDDENFSQATVARMLRGLGCVDIRFAEDGAEAIQVLSSGNQEVDVIISDFNMPVVHGLQLLRAIRGGTKNIRRATPFAMLTGYSDKRLVDFALAMDVNAFLIKPVSKDGLEKRLSKLLTQVKSDSWLKAADNYKSLDVDNILQEIARPESDQARQPGKDLLPKKQPLFRNSKTPLKPLDIQKREKLGPVEVKGLPDQPEKEIGVEARGLPDSPEKSLGVEAKGIQEPEVLGGDAPMESRPQLDGELCALDHLPENSILARDVYTADGRLFIHAGTELTPRIVSILYDLHDLHHPVESIWVAKDQNPEA